MGTHRYSQVADQGKVVGDRDSSLDWCILYRKLEKQNVSWYRLLDNHKPVIYIKKSKHNGQFCFQTKINIFQGFH